MKTDQLNGLIALKVVAEKKHFAAAAQILGVSPSAVSQTIKQLEQRLGVALLFRTTRSTNLTEAGERFLDQAGPALDQILNAMENVETYAEKPSGLLRLALPRAIFPTLVRPLIASFAKKYPDVTVELCFNDDVSDIVERGFDAGIRLSELLAMDMVALSLSGPIRFVTVASPKYFNEMGRPKHPKDLLSHNCIRTRFSDAEIYDQWEFESKGKEFRVQVEGSLILNDSVLVVNAALAGLGVVYYPEELVRDEIAAGKLEVVLKQFAAASDGFYLYYPTRSQVLPKLRALIEHIKTERKR
jgi:DNA-binding transcriptional LysR family regulator